ncbi:unnamed protein product [Amoebophrya sp. A25]|nr:unnamed protein product [Amoebophrya sp. A25]|eukprot:GSA25T00010739001.1
MVSVEASGAARGAAASVSSFRTLPNGANHSSTTAGGQRASKSSSAVTSTSSMKSPALAAVGTLGDEHQPRARTFAEKEQAQEMSAREQQENLHALDQHELALDQDELALDQDELALDQHELALAEGEERVPVDGLQYPPRTSASSSSATMISNDHDAPPLAACSPGGSVSEAEVEAAFVEFQAQHELEIAELTTLLQQKDDQWDKLYKEFVAFKERVEVEKRQQEREVAHDQDHSTCTATGLNTGDTSSGSCSTSLELEAAIARERAAIEGELERRVEDLVAENAALRLQKAELDRRLRQEKDDVVSRLESRESDWVQTLADLRAQREQLRIELEGKHGEAIRDLQSRHAEAMRELHANTCSELEAKHGIAVAELEAKYKMELREQERKHLEEIRTIEADQIEALDRRDENHCTERAETEAQAAFEREQARQRESALLARAEAQDYERELEIVKQQLEGDRMLLEMHVERERERTLVFESGDVPEKRKYWRQMLANEKKHPRILQELLELDRLVRGGPQKTASASKTSSSTRASTSRTQVTGAGGSTSTPTNKVDKVNRVVLNYKGTGKTMKSNEAASMIGRSRTPIPVSVAESEKSAIIGGFVPAPERSSTRPQSRGGRVMMLGGTYNSETSARASVEISSTSSSKGRNAEQVDGVCGSITRLQQQEQIFPPDGISSSTSSRLKNQTNNEADEVSASYYSYPEISEQNRDNHIIAQQGGCRASTSTATRDQNQFPEQSRSRTLFPGEVGFMDSVNCASASVNCASASSSCRESLASTAHERLHPNTYVPPAPIEILHPVSDLLAGATSENQFSNRSTDGQPHAGTSIHDVVQSAQEQPQEARTSSACLIRNVDIDNMLTLDHQHQPGPGRTDHLQLGEAEGRYTLELYNNPSSCSYLEAKGVRDDEGQDLLAHLRKHLADL